MTGGGGEEESLEYTPTWVVALICTVIVGISLALERLLHYTGKFLKRKKQGPLYEALLKIKEELMLLGFISLMLTVFQSRISRICIAKHLTHDWLPCNFKQLQEPHTTTTTSSSFFSPLLSHHHRLLLAATTTDDAPPAGYCEKEGMSALLSVEALHNLHIFIFVLAAVHVAFSALTILFGTLQIRRWKQWEDSIQKKEPPAHDLELGGQKMKKVTHVREHDFITKARFRGFGKDSALLSWVHSFFKQFYGSITKSDYTTLRRGFIANHYRDNPKFNFYNYMVRAFETDFKKVVGISWYLWIFVIVFLLLNVRGWHAYFWIAFVPLILLVGVGTKLEHIITQLGQEVAQRGTAVEGELVVKPSDHHFWFHSPSLVLLLIHIILFQNSFEIAIFFWTLVLFHFRSCIMGQIVYVIPRLVIGVVVQILCSYSTLPLYAIVAQMGSSFNKAIFEEHIQEKLTGWAHKAKGNINKGETTRATARTHALVADNNNNNSNNKDESSPPLSSGADQQSSTTTEEQDKISHLEIETKT